MTVFHNILKYTTHHFRQKDAVQGNLGSFNLFLNTLDQGQHFQECQSDLCYVYTAIQNPQLTRVS